MENGLPRLPLAIKTSRCQLVGKTIEVDSLNASFVVKMFELYATGINSFQTIADEMNKLGIAERSRVTLLVQVELRSH